MLSNVSFSVSLCYEWDVYRKTSGIDNNMYHIHVYCEKLNGIKQILLNVTTLWMILFDPDYYSNCVRSLCYLTKLLLKYMCNQAYALLL